MARPRLPFPTPGEFEILRLVWEHGELTVRDVHQLLLPHKPRAYTSIMTILKVMTDKGLLARRTRGRAFVYAAGVEERKTLHGMLHDMLTRVYRGSLVSLFGDLIDCAAPSECELGHLVQTLQRKISARESAAV
ncbi:MAG: BlaI/MecI/CopY family transcriptional regulator [Pirellulales bacterium]|nr:BlaI/MecI/CopY family transcriptional regulator [Pirellulales bacterium]